MAVSARTKRIVAIEVGAVGGTWIGDNVAAQVTDATQRKVIVAGVGAVGSIVGAAAAGAKKAKQVVAVGVGAMVGGLAASYVAPDTALVFVANPVLRYAVWGTIGAVGGVIGLLLAG